MGVLGRKVGNWGEGKVRNGGSGQEPKEGRGKGALERRKCGFVQVDGICIEDDGASAKECWRLNGRYDEAGWKGKRCG